MGVDEEHLALIEGNHPSALVQRLIWTIRTLQDELLAARCELEDARTAAAE